MKASITITKLFPSGGLELCAVINGYLHRRRYFGCDRRTAVRLFRSGF